MAAKFKDRANTRRKRYESVHHIFGQLMNKWKILLRYVFNRYDVASNEGRAGPMLYSTRNTQASGKIQGRSGCNGRNGASQVSRLS